MTDCSTPPAGAAPLQMPPDTPEYMRPAWLGALHFALGQEEIVAAFRGDTGNQWRPGTTGIDRLIDKATGVDERFLREFVSWFNANVWGPIDD